MGDIEVVAYLFTSVELCPGAGNCTLQGEEHGEAHAVHDHHSIQCRCQDKDRHHRLAAVEAAGTGPGQKRLRQGIPSWLGTAMSTERRGCGLLRLSHLRAWALV